MISVYLLSCFNYTVLVVCDSTMCSWDRNIIDKGHLCAARNLKLVLCIFSQQFLLSHIISWFAVNIVLFHFRSASFHSLLTISLFCLIDFLSHRDGIPSSYSSFCPLFS